MALSIETTKKVWLILHEINPKANNSFIQNFTPGDDPKPDVILGCGKKYDGGWENVFMYVKDITQEQRNLFEKKRYGLGNTSFITDDDEDQGFTCLGWI